MNPMQIISADERLRERRGAKVLIMGPTGVGKTSLLRTLNPERTLFIDVEAGDLSVLNFPVPTIRLDDWPTARAEIEAHLRVGNGFQGLFVAGTDWGHAHPSREKRRRHEHPAGN